MYPGQKLEEIEQFLHIWHQVVDDYYDVLTAVSEMSVESQKKKFLKSLQDLQGTLTVSNAGPFVLGDTFSVAECIAAPWVQRFFVTLPYFRKIDLDHVIRNDTDYEKVVNWMDAIRTRPSVARTACPPEEMLAAAQRYYVSYFSPGSPASSSLSPQ
mmetsp:Transcript_15245/g.28492  ORF Transcript_15245/g.28492 Transcript_15245/m.28492 type:complete len:156 (+) Transcript_15245:608-1075(+)